MDDQKGPDQSGVEFIGENHRSKSGLLFGMVVSFDADTGLSSCVFLWGVSGRDNQEGLPLRMVDSDRSRHGNGAY